MEDIRYSEFIFLQSIATGHFKYFNHGDSSQLKVVGLNSTTMYLEMVIGALEDLHIRIRNDAILNLAARLRGELDHESVVRQGIPGNYWSNPRYGLQSSLQTNTAHEVEITYRGLQRIEELREALRRDRILEFFGVLLDLRYFRPDLMRVLQQSDIPVTVLYADMDNFGQINKKFGQAAGDVVMKAYLEAVRDELGEFGNGYRSLGDETVSLIVGQEHERSVALAEGIRSRVKAMECSYKGKDLPRVSASIGVATTPPEGRTADIIDIAEERKRKAKEAGKDCVISK